MLGTEQKTARKAGVYAQQFAIKAPYHSCNRETPTDTHQPGWQGSSKWEELQDWDPKSEKRKTLKEKSQEEWKDMSFKSKTV